MPFHCTIATADKLHGEVDCDYDLATLINNLLMTFWEDEEPNVMIIRDDAGAIHATLTPGFKYSENDGEVHVVSLKDGTWTHERWHVNYMHTDGVFDRVAVYQITEASSY
jgi:hypothetical protein